MDFLKDEKQNKGDDSNQLGSNSFLDAQLSIPLPNIKTYKSDVSVAVQRDNISAVKIALAEQARENRIGDIEQQNSVATTKSIILISLTVICILIAAGGTWYFIHRANNPVTALPQTTKPVIATNSVINIFDVDKKTSTEILRDIENARKDFDLQSLIQINKLSLRGASSTEISAQAFLGKIGASVPNSLYRSITPSYFAGFTKNGLSTSSPYIVLQTDSYEQAYAGMFEWENSILRDLGPYFDTNSFSPFFKDIVIKNRDVRAVMSNTDIVLLYVFLDSKTILITNNKIALQNITDAYLLSKRVQ